MASKLPLIFLKKWVEANPVKMTSIFGLASQVGRPLVSLVTLPLLFHELGEGELGLWLISLSVLGIFNFVSTGISSCVITHVGRIPAVDKNQVTQLITAGFIIAAACATILITVMLPLVFLLDWPRLLDLDKATTEGEVVALSLAIITLLGLSFVCIIPRQVMFGRMHGYLAHLLDLIGLVLGAVGLIWATLEGAPLWAMALLFMGPSIIFVFLGGLVYLRLAGIVAFTPRQLERTMFHKLRDDALRMSGYQMAFAVSAQTDMLLIGIFLGSAATVPFGVAHRVFSILVLVGYTLNQAQWPAMARADAAGDRASLIPVFRRTLFFVPLVVSVVAIGITLAYEPLVTLWLGTTPETDELILWGMVAWVSVVSAANTCDHLLRARNETRFLMQAMWVMAMLNLALTLFLLQHIGAAGAIWGSVIGYFVAVLLPFLWHLRHEIWNNSK